MLNFGTCTRTLATSEPGLCLAIQMPVANTTSHQLIALTIVYGRTFTKSVGLQQVA